MEIKTIQSQLDSLKQQLKNTETLHIKVQGAIEALESLLSAAKAEEPKKSKSKK